MPFDVLPQETETKFKKFADAMLMGCAVTTQIKGAYLDGNGGACALGAMLVGLGFNPRQRLAECDSVPELWTNDVAHMAREYRYNYGSRIFEDNDAGGYTREQIAARIAAL